MPQRTRITGNARRGRSDITRGVFQMVFDKTCFILELTDETDKILGMGLGTVIDGLPKAVSRLKQMSDLCEDKSYT